MRKKTFLTLFRRLLEGTPALATAPPQYPLRLSSRRPTIRAPLGNAKAPDEKEAAPKPREQALPVRRNSEENSRPDNGQQAQGARASTGPRGIRARGIGPPKRLPSEARSRFNGAHDRTSASERARSTVAACSRKPPDRVSTTSTASSRKQCVSRRRRGCVGGWARSAGALPQACAPSERDGLCHHRASRSQA